MILRNARVILPDGIRDDVDIVVRHGRIAEVRPSRGQSGSETVDLNANYVAPGFIDLHVHGAIGRDTMERSADAFRAICDYHASGGTTSLLLTTATAPLAEITETLSAIGKIQAELPQVLGAHVEGPFLSPARPGAQRAEFICAPDAASGVALLQHAGVVKRVTIAPEISGALDLMRDLVAAGIAVSGGHSDAWDEEARAGFAAGMRHVTHTFNCMSSMRRRGRERVAGLLEVALSEPEITCELIADGHHVSSTLMKLLYRAKGAAGICLVTDATAGAGLPEGAAFELAGRKCVAENGVCLLEDRSALAGSAARMIDLVRMIVQTVGAPLHEAIQMASANPAKTLGLAAKGRIAEGADADLVMISPKLEIVETFLGGRRVFPRVKEGS
ncbi:MAG: N-acetylglucosamine-6-phosphate deacetylase [Chthoniobacterales bacterium]